MEGKDFKGLNDFEIMKLINKKKKRYCAIALNDLEEETLGLDEASFKRIRKVFLDNINAYTRSIFTIVGIDIEGVED